MIEELIKRKNITIDEALIVIKEYLKEVGIDDFNIDFFVNCNYYLQDPQMMMRYSHLANGNGISIAYQQAQKYFKQKFRIIEYKLFLPNGQQLVFNEIVDGNPVYN